MRDSYAVLERKRRAILKKIANTGPFIMGATASLMKIRCGNPRCKCAKDKRLRHEKLHLSWTTKDLHSTQYVPVDLHEEVKEWIENYWTIREYMKEMSDLSRRMIKIYNKSKPKKLARKKKTR